MLISGVTFPPSIYRPSKTNYATMTQQTGELSKKFDAEKYKNTTRQQWDQAADAWNNWGPFLRRWLGPSTETLLDLCQVGKGSKVLVVAAGAGDETLQIAKRVGPSGYVLATDISPRILEFAARNAEQAGHRNVETLVVDGEALEDTISEGRFDAVISRVGLIYFPNRQKALAGMKRSLKQGGRIGAIVYSTPDNNKFFSIPVSVIRTRANLPPPLPGQPGPFSLGSPGVLEKELTSAGFVNAESMPVNAPVILPSAAECLRFERESFGALHTMLSGLDESAKEQAWQEIHEKLRQFEIPGQGFVGPCELIVGVASKE